MLVLEHAKLGSLKGITATATLTRFLGIPYGTIKQRFARSAIVNKLPGASPTQPFDATRSGPSSIQSFGSIKTEVDGQQFPSDGLPEDEPQSEDCLNLNITVPNECITDSRRRLPVLVWIHGGAFALGSANRPFYDPVPLCKHALDQGTPFIFVAINYRLSALGFFHCPEAPDLVPENNGLHDQLLALDWIKTNIEGFGGDASKITVIGQSAGGDSVSLHSMSHELPKPVYRRAMMFSGTPVTMPAKTPEQHGENFTRQARKLGIEVDGRSMLDVATEMIRIPVDKIRSLGFVGAPCSKTEAMPYDEPTMAIMRDGDCGNKHWAEAQIISAATYDGGISYNLLLNDKKRKDHAQVFKKIAHDVVAPDQADELLHIYDIRPDDEDIPALRKICLFESDIGFLAPALSLADGQHAQKDTYLQIFDLGNPFEGPLPTGQYATHTLDIVLLFGGFEDKLSADYQTIVTAWRNRIIDFVVSGKAPCEPWRDVKSGALVIDQNGVREMQGKELMDADGGRRRRLLELADRVDPVHGRDILWNVLCRRFLMNGE